MIKFFDADGQTPQNAPARRKFLQQSLAASGVLAIGPSLWGPGAKGSPRSALPADASPRVSNIPNLSGTLKEVSIENDPDTRMLIPEGFSVREVARTGTQPTNTSDYVWHRRPDGGATFATEDGGWIYVSNSEVNSAGEGGVGALRFNATGNVVDSYSICNRTTNNCAGGPTPWGTWLTCEEIDGGLVYECDPAGRETPTALPALGAFKHEAAAVDIERGHIYLTEDEPDGNFYRFTPDRKLSNGRLDLNDGLLEVAVVAGGDPDRTRGLTWAPVPNPTPRRRVGWFEWGDTPTRNQVLQATPFDGGEGCWFHQDVVYFTTKGDNRVWAVDVKAQTIDVIYDRRVDDAIEPGIADVDNIVVSETGDILVAEDGAEMRIVVVGPDLKPFELINIMGHRGSEVVGPAFSPDGTRLYFSSQRGPSGRDTDGRTYEVRGSFFQTM